MVEFNLNLFTSVQATTGRINAGNYEIHLMFTKIGSLAISEMA
jgi:hypothetical protein